LITDTIPQRTSLADRATALSAILVTALAAGLSISFLGEKGFWLDEALSVQRAAGDWTALWRDVTTTQANMGLYYVLLHGWIGLGDSELIVRALSAVFATATVPVVYGLTRRFFGGRAALTAALLLALNSFFIAYAQEARGYSLAILLSAVATWRFAIAVEQPSARAWAAYALAGSVALYAHFFCALVLLAHAVSIVFLNRGSIPWRGLIASATAIAVATCPLIWFVVFNDVGQIDWVPAPRAVDLYYLLARFAGGGWALPVLSGLAIAAAVALAMGPRRATAGAADRWRVALIFCWLLVPIALAYGISFAKPVFQPRFLLVSLVPFVMLVSAGLARLPGRAAFAAAVGIVALLSGQSVRAWYDAPDKQWWRAAAQLVSARAMPGDAVTFFVYSARVPFEYYVRQIGTAEGRLTLVDLADGFVAGNRQPEPSRERLQALARAHPRVWLVRLQDGTPPGHPLRRYEQSRVIESELGATHRMTGETPFPGGIRIQLYER
jgi:mannosyltransferase